MALGYQNRYMNVAQDRNQRSEYSLRKLRIRGTKSSFHFRNLQKKRDDSCPRNSILRMPGGNTA